MKTVTILHGWQSDPVYVTEVADNDPQPMRTALERASLSGANLGGASLSGASLSGASLARANLSGANLVGADLGGANLVGADLGGADLDGANLDGANLGSAYLDGANLGSAYLDSADLVGVRDDLWSVLDTSQNEVAGLLSKLRAGEIEGSQYQGECACLVGTIGNLRHVRYDEIPELTPNSSRPSERWFLAIRKGETPDNNPIAAITADWICAWIAARGEDEWSTP